MRMLSTSGGWRVSILSATTRGFQWTHGKRLVSRSVKPSEPPTASPSTEHAVSSKASTPAEDANTSRAYMSTPRSEIGGRIGKRWSADETRYFVELYDKGLSTRLIAAQMPGRTFVAIQGMCVRHKRNNLPQPGARNSAIWTIVERKKLLELSDAGLTLDEMRPHFSDRSAESIKSTLENARIECPQGGVPTKVNWSATDVSKLRRHVAQGTSVLDISRCLNRSRVAVRKKILKLGIGERPHRITPEEDQKIAEMHKAGYRHSRIAELLGLTQSNVDRRYKALRQLKSRNREKRGRCRFELPSKELEEVDRLRKQGATWEMITRQMLFDVTPNTLVCAFRRQMEEAGRPMPLKVSKHKERRKKSAPLIFSPTDLENITAQRKDGKTWPGIIKLGFPKLSCDRVRRAYFKQAPVEMPRIRLKMAATDTQKITRLRNDGMSWNEIARLEYPGWSYQNVWRVHLAKTQEQLGQDTSSAE